MNEYKSLAFRDFATIEYVARFLKKTHRRLKDVQIIKDQGRWCVLYETNDPEDSGILEIPK